MFFRLGRREEPSEIVAWRNIDAFRGQALCRGPRPSRRRGLTDL
jgi:hypothetical protein